jgi:hypothetical protein
MALNRTDKKNLEKIEKKIFDLSISLRGGTAISGKLFVR